MMFQGCSLSLLSGLARTPLGTTLSILGLKQMFIARHGLIWSADLAPLKSMADIIKAALLFLLISH